MFKMKRLRERTECQRAKLYTDSWAKNDDSHGFFTLSLPPLFLSISFKTFRSSLSQDWTRTERGLWTSSCSLFLESFRFNHSASSNATRLKLLFLAVPPTEDQLEREEWVLRFYFVVLIVQIWLIGRYFSFSSKSCLSCERYISLRVICKWDCIWD